MAGENWRALHCGGVQSRDWTLRKCVALSRLRFRSYAAFKMECYSEDMRILPGSSLAQLVERDRNGAMQKETVEKHIIAMAPRANFARAYIARGGRDGNGKRLDPVLAAHLGLDEQAE
jgi:hypothetical protein